MTNGNLGDVRPSRPMELINLWAGIPEPEVPRGMGRGCHCDSILHWRPCRASKNLPTPLHILINKKRIVGGGTDVAEVLVE
jgi:hypothetical protein